MAGKIGGQGASGFSPAPVEQQAVGTFGGQPKPNELPGNHPGVRSPMMPGMAQPFSPVK